MAHRESPRRGNSITLHHNHNTSSPISMKQQQQQQALDDSARSGSRRRIFDVSRSMDRLKHSFIGETNNNNNMERLDVSFSEREDVNIDTNDTNCRPKQHSLQRALGQVPAVLLIAMFHLMVGIPFGVSYFPVGWNSSANTSGTSSSSMDNNNIDDDTLLQGGGFPIPGKEALGIRMFLFSTIMGQLVFTTLSSFTNPIGLQMVENVPFCHALSHIVLSRQGYGTDSLSTLFVMFGLSSIIVGGVFYTLGRLQLGRVVYYFPTHVLVGCIGGIGVFIAKTGLEVTMDQVFGFASVVESWQLLVPVLVFEVVLRILERVTVDENGKPLFSLLSPIYFCLITPFFYLAMWLLRVDLQQASQDGFFFPSLLDDSSSVWEASAIFNRNLFDMWLYIDLSVVSWKAIGDSIPTLVALTLFSLIHVPINIPAFAISTGTDADMNRELVAHGYSNILSGVFGGLQNYMAYTQSVLYHKSGGTGKASGISVAAVSACLFFVGPAIASFIPRCMAGTLLLHVGIDLFLEGVYDSIGKFDPLEYAGIWLICLVMTIYGMDAAMIAGGIAAVTTHAVQSIHYVNPVRGAMSASTLRSSKWNRSNEAHAVLDDDRLGRNRILVVQLQGHLFFGNMAQLIERINALLSERAEASPWIVVLDFSLVLGIDSSAALTMTKLRDTLRKTFGVDLCIFVTGSDDGFPCEFDLTQELKASCDGEKELGDVEERQPSETSVLLDGNGSENNGGFLTGSHVEDSLDRALIVAEDAILSRNGVCGGIQRNSSFSTDEREIALLYLTNLIPGDPEMEMLTKLFSKFQREVYHRDDIIWTQGSPGDCVKLLIHGRLIAILENEAGTSETIDSGNTIGELGLVQGVPRMSSVKCISEEAILYSLSKNSFEELVRSAPKAARLIDLMCIRYLSARVQHVSNRIFETRCLPI